jgi:hypothetical protein
MAFACPKMPDTQGSGPADTVSLPAGKYGLKRIVELN